MSEQAQPTSVHGDFEIRTCLSEAWASTWAGFPGWLLVLAVGGFCMMLAAITIIGLFLVVPVLAWGSVLYFLNLHDRRESLGDLFAGFSRYGEALVAMLVTVLGVAAVSLVGQAVSMVGELTDSTPLVLVGALVNLGWALFIVPRFYFAYFYVVDRGESPVEAITGAWERTAAVKWKVAGLTALSALATVVIALPAALVLFVGITATGGSSGSVPVLAGGALFALLLTVPIVFFYLVWVSAYRQMEGPSPVSGPA